MPNSNVLGVCFILTMALSLGAEAKLYKWVDDKGATHYGEVIPPEHANAERDSLNKSGLLETRPEKADSEASRAKEEAEQKRKVANQALVEQQRRNRALLNTYSNEKEIDLALERSLVLINARIESNKMLLLSSQETLAGHNKEVETRTKAGKKIHASLTKDITHRETSVAKYTAELSKSEDDLASVKTRFENEKTLYRNLTSGTTKK